MLRIFVIVAIAACVAGLAAPSVFPAMLQGLRPAPPTRPAPAPVTPAPVAPAVPASASNDDSAASVEIDANSRGQYAADVVVDGASVHMLVDTGATLVSLSHDTATRVGIVVADSDYTLRMRTANGLVRAAPVTLFGVSVGDIYLPGVEAVVMESQAGPVDLLGMSFLKRLSGLEQKGGRLILRQ